MRLRSPAEYYLKYLVVHPDQFSDDQVIEIFKSVDLDYISKTYVQKLRARCKPSLPFRPNERSNSRSYRFLIKEGILKLFHPDADTKLAFRTLETARSKEFVESMILSHAPSIAISNELNRRGHRCTAAAIDQYRKFFWNIDLLDSTQMRALLLYRVEMSGEAGEEASKESRAEHKAAKKAAYMDPRNIAAELPYSPITALLSQMRMGVMPTKLDLAKTLMLGQSVAAMRVLEASLQGSMQDSQRALNFAIVAKNLTEVLETAVKPDEDLREKLQAIALQTESGNIPSIHQLSGGRHTVDVEPKPVAEAEYEPVTRNDGADNTSP